MYPNSNQKLNYETDEAVYFFTEAFELFSNWSAHRVRLWGQTFPTAEHAYHYQKFAEHMPELAQQIMDAASPWAAMQIERANKQNRRSDWESVKLGIMTEILYAKVNQNEDVKSRLLATGSKKIVENSPWDDFWGAGADGKGENQIGKIYMKIRDLLGLELQIARNALDRVGFAVNVR